MKLSEKNPPRKYSVGLNNQITISDCGDIHLSPDEQITFVTDEGSRADFARKDWGFYATPSVNSRLKNEGFKTALVKNTFGQLYVMVVEVSNIEKFHQYCDEDQQDIIVWLDEFDTSKHRILMEPR